MTIRCKTDARIDIDDRYHVVIRRIAPPPMASAQLVISVYPITDGEVWDDPCDTFVVDEGCIIELENEMKE